MKITEVLGVRPNAYQGKTGVDFKVEGNPNKISALTDSPGKFTIGADLPGNIVPKEKDGRTFYNYSEARGGGGNAASGELRKDLYRLEVLIKQLTTRLENAGVIPKVHPGTTEPLNGPTSDGRPQPFPEDEAYTGGF